MRSSARTAAIVEHCSQHGRITAVDCERLFGMTRGAALSLLRRHGVRGVLFKMDRGVWALDAGLAATGVSLRILDLASRRLMVSITTMERELGVPRKSLWEALGRLRKSGEMHRVRYGVWRKVAA